MKRVYLSVRPLLSAGAALLLGWLGFSGYSKTLDAGMAEYGMSTVDYEFKVRITSQDARPVEGLQVDLPGSYGDGRELTGTRDNVEIDRSYTGFHRDHQVVLKVRDVDDEKNDVVADKQMTVEVKGSDFVSKDSKKWNDGEVKKAIGIRVERE